MDGQCVSYRVAGRFQWRCLLLLRHLIRDSPWFKTESLPCALVTLVRYCFVYYGPPHTARFITAKPPSKAHIPRTELLAITEYIVENAVVNPQRSPAPWPPYKLSLPYRKAFYLLCEFWQCHILIHAPRADHVPSLPIILSSRRHS